MDPIIAVGPRPGPETGAGVLNPPARRPSSTERRFSGAHRCQTRALRVRAAGSERGVEPGRSTMPPQQWSEKRERQYEHIKEGLREHGRSEDMAEEIAARTVNKERARSGEAKTKSRSSTQDISSGRRGGLRSHTGPKGRTYDQLYNEAKERGLEGRSKMSKAQLERALDR